MLVGIFLIILLIPTPSFAANYYVDPTYNGSNGTSNGSYLRPWTNIAGQVRAHSFETGDRLYFRVGTITAMNSPLYITWNGTKQNRVVIGAYFGENDFGNGEVNSDQRPVLDGQNFLVPSDNNTPMIQSTNHPGFVTIQDLEIKDSGGMGIFVGNTHQGAGPENYDYLDQYYIIRNNFINRPWTNGITVARSSHNQILDNVAYRTSYGHFRTHPHRGTNKKIGGASIETTGLYIYGTSEYNVISGNTISLSSYEGIGAYKRTRYATIKNNVVYDCSVNIYIDCSRDITISGNLVYATPEARRGPNNARNILIEHEYMDAAYGTPHPPIQSITENVKVFNNYVAGGQVGIGVSVYEGVEWGQRNIEIFNNRIVDNQYNFSFYNLNVGNWQNNYIYGNYSFKYDDSTLLHTRMVSPYSFTWNRDTNNTLVPNYFTGNTMPTGNAGQGALFNTSQLVKKTGWRDLQPGKVDKSFFTFANETFPLQKVTNLRIN